MSQHDFNITPADANTGVEYRAAVNAALQALAGLSNGPTAPTTTYPYQLWADTTTYWIKQRNSSNTGWNFVLPLIPQMRNYQVNPGSVQYLDDRADFAVCFNDGAPGTTLILPKISIFTTRSTTQEIIIRRTDNDTSSAFYVVCNDDSSDTIEGDNQISIPVDSVVRLRANGFIGQWYKV